MAAPTPRLEVNSLTVRYRIGRNRLPLVALREVSLAIGPGETVAVVGESGSGKSTLGNAILGLVPAAAGTILFEGEDITHAAPAQRRGLTRLIQAIFQDPYGSLNPVRNIAQTLVEPLRAHAHLKRAEARERVGQALEAVGLTREDASRYPADFSGGQRQRIAIARALILRPRLLVCDEPTSALDLSIQAQILNLLKELQQELGMSYLFITHDLGLVRHMATRVLVLYQGQVMESGDSLGVSERPLHPYTQALLRAMPTIDPAEQRERRRVLTGTSERSLAVLPDGCPFAPRCPFVLEACGKARPPLNSVASHLVACIRAEEWAPDHLQPSRAQHGEPSRPAMSSRQVADTEHARERLWTTNNA
jgi:oligopeptide/dipeptide ABC transporter ATP-binding protein